MMVGKINVKDKDGKEVREGGVGSPRPQPGERRLQRHRRRHPRCAGRDRPGNGHARSLVLLQLGGRGEVRPLDGRARARSAISSIKLAIVLDDVLQTAPTLQSAITDYGRITGNFTQQEVDEIVDIINAGSLPAALEPTPVRDMTTEATLGAETIRQSKIAMIIAVDRRAAVHALLLPLCRPGGRARSWA